MAALKNKALSSSSTGDHRRTQEGLAQNHTPKKKPQQSQQRKSEKAKARTVVQSGGGEHAGPSHSGVPSTSVAVGEQKEWPWVSITDASPSRQPPVFTKDGSYFFTIVGSSVKVYSVTTGLVVSTLSSGAPGSHLDTITSAILSPHNAFQLITASLDGCVKTWNFLDGVLLQTLDVGHSVHFVTAHRQFREHIFVSATKRGKTKGKEKASASGEGLVLRVSTIPTLETATVEIQKSSDITLVGKTRLPRGLSISSSGAWLVAVAGHKAYVASMANLKAGFTKFVSPEALTCLAFHPLDDYFATGDEKGVIRLWYCLDADMTSQTAAGVEKRAPTTTLHWHAHAVSALAFSTNGAYLLSGGEESVLVIWQIHTGKKEYVPRVGAPIANISVSRHEQEEYLLGLTDASFVFVGAASLKITRSFAQIKLGSSSTHTQQSSAHTPLAVHSLSATLILPSSHPSSLQAYSPSRSKLVAELEVAPSNRVSRRDQKALEPPRVERAIISPSGEWMATLDARSGDDSFRGEAYLKIWRWHQSSGFWILNTRFDRPHGLRQVTSLSFSPAPHDLLVTTGQDGNIKTWRLRTVQAKKKESAESFWVLRATSTFRNETPTHASWSPDGSLYSISLGPFVAFYDAHSNGLVNTLTARELCLTVTSAHFLGNGGRYLAAVGKCDVVMWDLVMQRVERHYRSEIPIYDAVAHPYEDRLAILEQLPSSSPDTLSTQITTLDVHSYAPSNQATVPFHLRAAMWYPPSQSHEPASFSIVGITTHDRAVLFGDETQTLADPGASTNGLVDTSASSSQPSLFRDIFGKSAFTESPVESPAFTPFAPSTSARRETADILDVPAYLLPSIDSLYDTLLGPFLQHRPTEEPVANELADGLTGDIDSREEGMDVDADAEVKEPLLGRSFIEREEIGTFVELFRRIAVKSPHERDNASSLARIHAAFGTSSRAPPKSKRKEKDKSIPQPTPQESYPSPESTPSLTAVPPTVGKKRRKSQAS